MEINEFTVSHLGGRKFFNHMTTDWKNRLKAINYRKGLDRIYFVLTLAWFAVWYFAFLFETLDSKINLYTDNIYGIIFGHIFVLIAPVIAYVVLVLIFKIFLWVIGGFQENAHAISQTKVKIFAGEGSYFELIKKHKILIMGVIVVAILIGVFISFIFTSYNSYEER